MHLAAALLTAIILATPAQRAVIRHDADRLPPCILGLLNQQLVEVQVKRQPPDRTGESWPNGVTEIENVRDTRTLYHELGHQVDFFTGASFDPDFQHAVAEDFRHLTPGQVKALKYYNTPLEAWAELFSLRYFPRVADDVPINLLKNANREESLQLQRMEACQ